MKCRRAFISVLPYEMSQCSLDQIRNVCPESPQHFRALCVTQLMMMPVEKSIQVHFLQCNFPMPKYLKVKKKNNTSVHTACKFKLVFSNEMF